MAKPEKAEMGVVREVEADQQGMLKSEKAQSQHSANKRIQPTAKSAARSSLCFLRRLMLDVTATLSRQFHCCSQKEMRYNHGVVSPVPAPGVRHQQRWGAEHSVKRRTASSTPALRWEMMGMDNVSKASSLHIVKGAELELPFGSRAKMATVVRQASFDGGPAHSQHHPVYRGVLTPSCGIGGTR
jgi:hypothetical protein